MVTQESKSWMVWVLGLYALLMTVPIAELLARMGLRSFAPPITEAILILALLSTGRAGEFFKLPFAKPYMAFYIFALMAGMLGSYPGRSMDLLMQYGLRFHIIPVICCAIAISTNQVRKVYSWIGIGAFLLLVLCILFGEMDDDRLVIKDTSLANPNDLGFAIVYSMTALLVFRSKALQILSLLSIPGFLLYILKTGSRADLVTLIAVTLIASFFAPSKWRIALLVGLPVIAAGVIVAVPAETRERLFSVFSVTPGVASGSAEVMRAGDSANARRELSLRAFELAVRHPVFGVGATNFEDGVEDMIESLLHKKSSWQVAHNTWLQIAAENGFPAFICYVWVLFAALKMNYRSYRLASGKDGVPEAMATSFALLMMTVMFMVCTTFSNNSFDAHFNILLGLTAANYLAIERERLLSKVQMSASGGGARTQFLARSKGRSPQGLKPRFRPAYPLSASPSPSNGRSLA